MTALLDTDVLVDCLRGTRAAGDWLERVSDEQMQVPGVVAMELVVGCRNRQELDSVQRFLSRFDVIWPEAAEFARAYEILSSHHLSSQMSIPDSLVASMAVTRGAKLYTFNARHYRSISGLGVAEPYARSS